MKHVLLIDAHSLIHRCYHALPPLSNSQKEPTGALYGVATILLKLLSTSAPDYAVALFDRPEPTFRKERFQDYKAHRPKADEELISQLIRARELFHAFSIPTVEKAGFEADDLIGTLAQRFKKEDGVLISILTGDLDSLQLVDDGRVVVTTFKKGISDTITYDEEGVIQKLGVTPSQVVDYKALVGDTSDNIPGVPGIGPKTASAILKKYPTLKEFLKRGEGDALFEKIKGEQSNVLLWQELARLDCEAPINTTLEDIVFKPNQESIISFFEKNDFLSLIKRLSPRLPKESPILKQTTQKGGGLTPQGDALFISAHAPLPRSITTSPKLKVGSHIKELLKTTAVQEPFFDVSIGYELLEIRGEWEDISKKVFGGAMEEKKFLERSYQWLLPQLKKRGVWDIFEHIEMPLIPVLASMEQNGICIDHSSLKRLQSDIEKKIGDIKETIYKTIDPSINLNSPKQLLEYFKGKGASVRSTAAPALEKISDKFPIVKHILTYREYFKLKTTYIDAFEKLTQKNGKIHPTFLQLGAATGRLSCQNPNLQNIPQESVWAKPLRDVFVPSPGYTFVSFDYSQIELRVLASLSGDNTLMRAFKNGEDIHSLTAHTIFSVPLERVTTQQRRLAKTLNFGVIYGMGPRAFSQQSGLSVDEAKAFIKKYFEGFSAVKKWQELILKEARTSLETRNKNGRFRSIPGIHSSNPRFVAEAERIALNMPLQGLAADILKKAMRTTFDYLVKKAPGGAVRMLLSIHDELLFEIRDELLAEGKESRVVSDITELMESAYPLNVPLTTSVTMGKRWGEMN